MLTNKPIDELLAAAVPTIIRHDLPKPCLEVLTLNERASRYLARAVLERKQGPLRTLITRHICDNNRCVELSHLTSGTHKHNTNDAIERGRFTPAEYVRKYDHALINRVHEFRSQGWSYRQIAREIGLSKTYVADLITGCRPRNNSTDNTAIA